MTRLTLYQQVHKHALKPVHLKMKIAIKIKEKKYRNVADFAANNHLLFIMPLVKTRSRYMALQ